MTTRIAVILNEDRTEKLIALGTLMECTPENVVYNAIDTMWLEMIRDD